MRPAVKRRLVTLAAAASLLLCVALWVRSSQIQSSVGLGQGGADRRTRLDWEPKLVELDTRRFRSRSPVYSEVVSSLGQPDLRDDRWTHGERVVYFYDDRSAADAAAELVFDQNRVLIVVNYYPDSRKLDRRGLQPNPARSSRAVRFTPP
jgi:hypothetical protein